MMLKDILLLIIKIKTFSKAFSLIKSVAELLRGIRSFYN